MFWPGKSDLEKSKVITERAKTQWRRVPIGLREQWERVYARFRGCAGVKCDVVASDRHILIDLVRLPWWSRG